MIGVRATAPERLCHLALTVGISTAAILVVVAFLPPPDIARATAPHWLLHAAVFAILGLAWTVGLPRVSALRITLAIVTFGFLHEAIEIFGHGHSFEFGDALNNAVGTVTGTLVGSMARR
jgi:hypothetical protein